MSKSHHFQHIIFEKAEKPTLCDQEELCSNTIVPPSKASLDENICKFWENKESKSLFNLAMKNIPKKVEIQEEKSHLPKNALDKLLRSSIFVPFKKMVISQETNLKYLLQRRNLENMRKRQRK